MVNVSNSFKQQLYNDNRKYLGYADVTLKDGTILHLTNEHIWTDGLYVEDAVSGDNSFDIGSAIINKCTLTINNCYDEFSEYDFADAEIRAYAGLELPDESVEKARKGVFGVDEAKYNGMLITLSCLDNMRKFDRPYSDSRLAYPATLNQIVRDACSVCGVPLQTYNFPHDDFIVQTRPNDEAITFREIISWCAQIACCFCRCDTLGRLELKWYDQESLEKSGLDGGIFDSLSPNRYMTGDNADGGSFKPWNTGYVADGGEFGDRNDIHYIYSTYSLDISTDDVVITGVKVVEKNKEENQDALTTYQSGTDGYVVSIENNELIKAGAGQTIVGWIGEQLIGFRFRKASITHASDPTIEAGDVGYLIDSKQNVYRIVISSTKFNIGNSQTTTCSAQNPARNSAARFSAETKNYVDLRKDIEKEKTDREKALGELQVRIDNSSGLYTTEVTQPDKSTIFYMHDKPTLSESKIVWKMTAEAFAVSTDGGKTYNAGLTVDGDLIARILSVTGFYFDWAKGGTLTLGGRNNVNGTLVILNNSGSQIGKWDKDGINATNGSFSGTVESTKGAIGGFTIGGHGLKLGSLFGNSILNKEGNESLYIGETGMRIKNSETQNLISFQDGMVYYYDTSPMLQGGIGCGGERYAGTGFGIYQPVGGSEPEYWRRVLGTMISTRRFIGVYGDFTVSSSYTKSKEADTENYGHRLLYCYEMPSPMFGDIGEGETDENGECYIDIGDIFSETIANNIEYHVFLQKEGYGDIWIDSKKPSFFVVKGTPNLRFSWEIKAKQKGFEYERLEVFDDEPQEPGVPYVSEYMNEIKQLLDEKEDVLYETA